MQQQPPNEGIIWFRPSKTSQFRKYRVLFKGGTTIQLIPSTFSFLSRKVTIDLSKVLIQIIPAALVASAGASATSGGSSSSSSAAGGAAAAAEGGDAIPTDGSTSPRFHQVYSYISFVDKNQGAGDAERLVFRTIDDHDRDRWFQIFLHLSGRSQSMAESYPYGKIGRKGEIISTDGTRRSISPTNAEDTVECSTGSSSDSSMVNVRIGGRRRRSTAHRNSVTRDTSKVFEGVPVVSVSKKKSRSEAGKTDSSAKSDTFQLVVEDASSSDSEQGDTTNATTVHACIYPTSVPPSIVPKGFAKQKRNRPKSWCYVDPAGTATLGNADSGTRGEVAANSSSPSAPPAPPANPFLENLWQRCKEKDSVLLGCKEVPATVTPFAANVLNFSGNEIVTAAVSPFTQDPRSIVAKHGVVVNRIDHHNNNSNSNNSSTTTPVVALATVSAATGILIAPQLTGIPSTVIQWEELLSVVPKEVITSSSEGVRAPPTTTTTQSSITQSNLQSLLSVSPSSAPRPLMRSSTQRHLRKSLLDSSEDDDDENVDDDPLEKSAKHLNNSKTTNNNNSGGQGVSNLSVSFVDLPAPGTPTRGNNHNDGGNCNSSRLTRRRSGSLGSAGSSGAATFLALPPSTARAPSFSYPLLLYFSKSPSGAIQILNQSFVDCVDIRFRTAMDRKSFLQCIGSCAVAAGKTESFLLRPLYHGGKKEDHQLLGDGATAARKMSSHDGMNWGTIITDHAMYDLVQTHLIAARTSR